MKKPWLCALSSVYIFPYFSTGEKKGKNFLIALSKNLFLRKIGAIDKYKPIHISPWYLSDFSSFFVVHTDGLHVYNHPTAIKKILNYLSNYIFLQEKFDENQFSFLETLIKVIDEVERFEVDKNSLFANDSKKGLTLFQKHWVSCFEGVLFSQKDKNFLETIEENYLGFSKKFFGNDLGLTKSTSDLFLCYRKRAMQWGESLDECLKEHAKENMSHDILFWEQFKEFDDFYRQAKNFFIEWWQQNLHDIRSVFIDYCQRHAVGKYTENLERIMGRNYPTSLTALSSGLFLAEEMIVFISKLLRDGPGVIIYPTPNLGAKEKINSPFLVLQRVIKEDLRFSDIMKFRHDSDRADFIIYTHPGKKINVENNASAEETIIAAMNCIGETVHLMQHLNCARKKSELLINMAGNILSVFRKQHCDKNKSLDSFQISSEDGKFRKISVS